MHHQHRWILYRRSMNAIELGGSSLLPSNATTSDHRESDSGGLTLRTKEVGRPLQPASCPTTPDSDGTRVRRAVACTRASATEKLMILIATVGMKGRYWRAASRRERELGQEVVRRREEEDPGRRAEEKASVRGLYTAQASHTCVSAWGLAVPSHPQPQAALLQAQYSMGACVCMRPLVGRWVHLVRVRRSSTPSSLC